MAQARALLFDIILGIRVDFVIAQAAEDAGVGPQACQLAANMRPADRARW